MQASALTGLAVVFATAALVFAAEARPASYDVHAARGTIRFFEHHQRLVWQKRTRPIALRAIARARAVIAAAAPAYPPHHSLWICIHGREASSWSDDDSGGNLHYGGLQMHAGYGYGTSYYASDDSELVQEWAAERAYRASGYSTTWLLGQWDHPDCLGYAT